MHYAYPYICLIIYYRRYFAFDVIVIEFEYGFAALQITEMFNNKAIYLWEYAYIMLFIIECPPLYSITTEYIHMWLRTIIIRTCSKI